MGLDIYVGALCRYYTGDWESVLQRMSREQNLPVVTVRPNTESSEQGDPAQVQQISAAWRDGLVEALRQHVEISQAWDEVLSDAYFTDRPGWEGYWALRLWAAYSEHPEFVLPTELPTDFQSDRAYLASTAEEGKTCYPHLLRDVELWLPIDFSFTFESESITGDEITVGSSIELCRELDTLNKRTWNASDTQMDQWCVNGLTPDNSLEQTARMGLASILKLTRNSVKHRLPMLLDY